MLLEGRLFANEFVSFDDGKGAFVSGIRLTFSWTSHSSYRPESAQKLLPWRSEVEFVPEPTDLMASFGEL